MSTAVAIPDFEFSGMYYAELLSDLIQYNRVNVPEITDEDAKEPFQQLVRDFALIGHLSNTLLDMVAKERFLATASLRSSVRAHLALIDYQLRQASPAVADMLLELAAVLASTTEIVIVGSKFSTESGATADAIGYEALESLTLTRTDRVEGVWAYDASGDSWTDHTADAITDTGSFAPGWGGAPAAGDMLYIGHTGALWDEIQMTLATAATGISAGVWEYYDPNLENSAPDSVTNNGTTLTFLLTDWLGALRRDGTLVRVQSTITGAYEDLEVDWDGENKITTEGFLSQGTPSTSAADYIVGSLWHELPGLTDDTDSLLTDGEQVASYTLPQTADLNWSKLDAGEPGEMYWIRFRVIAVAGPSLPSITQVRIDTGSQYALTTATQGVTQADNPVASSTGLADQSFTLAAFPVIDDATLRVYVTEASVESEWAQVDNFLTSAPTDKVFRVEFDDDGVATIIFGDSVTGKIPASGVDNIRATYRTMDDVDGNVGANTIVANASGIAFLNAITNPRPASGYQLREGTTAADLARLKLTGPASLRTLQRAVTSGDVETLAAAFQSAGGTSPVARALAIEEAFGVKTVEVVTVSTSGGALTSDQLAELELYFNGTPDGKTKGVLLLNQEATANNFTPLPVDVVATVYGGNLTAVRTALTALLGPLALQDDGVTYQWDFGGEVPFSLIMTAIQETTPKPRKVTLTTPDVDGITLGARELPVPGTFTITIVA